MMIQNAFPDQPLTRLEEHRFLGRDGAEQVQTESVLCEHALRVLVNGQLEMEFVCLPQFLPELIVGHLGADVEDTLAIGDSTNDLPMFRLAKHTVCMAGGMDEVKALCEYVTDSVMADGIEKALKHFGLI